MTGPIRTVVLGAMAAVAILASANLAMAFKCENSPCKECQLNLKQCIQGTKADKANCTGTYNAALATCDPFVGDDDVCTHCAGGAKRVFELCKADAKAAKAQCTVDANCDAQCM